MLERAGLDVQQGSPNYKLAFINSLFLLNM